MGLPEYVEGMKWEIAYWEHLARFGRRKRIWRSGWDRWALRLGDDEIGRRTLVIGPWVVALWNCRCGDCKFDERMLLDIVEAGVKDWPGDVVDHVNQTVAALNDDDFDEPLDDAIRNFAG